MTIIRQRITVAEPGTYEISLVLTRVASAIEPRLDMVPLTPPVPLGGAKEMAGVPLRDVQQPTDPMAIEARRNGRTATIQDVAAFIEAKGQAGPFFFSTHSLYQEYYRAGDEEVHDKLANSPNLYHTHKDAQGRVLARTAEQRQKAQRSAKAWRTLVRDALQVILHRPVPTVGIESVEHPRLWIPANHPSYPTPAWLFQSGATVWQASPMSKDPVV